ncbi:ABC transporter permease [Tritonibacter mobilis]|uniref:Polyamine ABC transporter permease n=1 Tax=Tritonibacter mobilis F1926 TaxID=1265309 RepID=A0A1B1A7A2_9RHOB|nr:ABC transporter permease [Tritonibacter mobilis]ANP42408.1 polyamine ABC transporter permease [Tritonibacter mobilis F1926]KJZ22678.1 polyamine ABC transporter permease [Tritonibacter mobilis]
MKTTFSMRNGQLVLSVLVAIFMVGPILAVIPISFSSGSFLSYPLPGFSLQWYEKVLQYDPWMSALLNSLIIGVASATLATILGTLAALGFARGNLVAQQFLMGVVISPMIIPLVVSGVAMYFFLAKLGLVATFSGLILAHTVLAVPFVVIPVMATLRGFDTNLVRAANSLGATPVNAFFRVTLPNIAPGVISGALFAFATSFDEVVVALFIAGPAQKTLPRQMFDGIRDNIEPSILAMSSLLVVISIFMLAATAWLARKTS